jgi:hypothetical protein
MIDTQLELNFDNENDNDRKLSHMQKQIDEMCESMGKVRRKLFSQMGELQKTCAILQQENETLRNMIKEKENREWSYLRNDSLFELNNFQRIYG